MDEATLVKLPVAERRGAWTTFGGDTWFSILFAGGIDAAADGLESLEEVGLVRRNVTSQVLDGKLPAPDGRWALLVELVGSDWVHFAAPETLSLFQRDFQLGNKLAEQSGLRVLTTGHEDCSGATFVNVQEGKRQVLRFESTGDDFRGEEVMSPEDMDEEDFEDWEGTFGTKFESETHAPDWWKQFDCEDKVHQALLAELEAYVPFVQALPNEHGKVGLFACHEDAILPEHIRRIDLVVLGDARLAEPNQANAQLADAIKEGNAGAVRAAIEAGADLSVLKNATITPLAYAVDLLRVKEPQRVEVVRALVEAGADPNAGGPNDDPPLFTAVGKSGALPAEAVEVINLLLDAGADIEAQGMKRFATGLNPLLRAVNEASLVAVQLLLKRGADLSAKDSAGQTALMKARKIVESLREQFDEKMAGDKIRAYERLADYLELVEQGGEVGDPQQHLAAEQAAADSKRRRMLAQGAKFERAMNDLGKQMDAAKSETNRQIEASLRAQPDSICLVRCKKADLTDAKRIAADTKKLTGAGFAEAGDFTIREMPGITIRALVAPEQCLVAAIGQTIMGVTWCDVVRFHSDGSAVTATTAPRVDGIEAYQSEKFEKLYCGDEPISFLLSEVRSVLPAAEPVPVGADQFVERFERYYAEDIAAKKGRCGKSS